MYERDRFWLTQASRSGGAQIISNDVSVHIEGAYPSQNLTAQNEILGIVERPFPIMKAMPHLQLLPGAIATILAETADSKTLTESDRYGLMAAILDESLSEEDRRAIDRLLRSVRRGQLEMA